MFCWLCMSLMFPRKICLNVRRLCRSFICWKTLMIKPVSEMPPFLLHHQRCISLVFFLVSFVHLHRALRKCTSNDDWPWLDYCLTMWINSDFYHLVHCQSLLLRPCIWLGFKPLFVRWYFPLLFIISYYYCWHNKKR